MTITELEQAITQLSEQELARFRAWFDEFDAQMWDKQIEEDIKSGCLDQLLAKVDEENNDLSLIKNAATNLDVPCASTCVNDNFLNICRSVT
jgi:hypothetical protein